MRKQVVNGSQKFGNNYKNGSRNSQTFNSICSYSDVAYRNNRINVYNNGGCKAM